LAIICGLSFVTFVNSAIHACTSENFTFVDGDWWPLVLYARNGQPG